MKKIMLLISSLIFLAACGNGSSGGEVDQTSNTNESNTTETVESPDLDKANTFTFALNDQITSVNPINVNDSNGKVFVNLIYSPLAYYHADGEVDYALAEDISNSEDGQTIRVTLREGLQWSDGEAVTADDVVFTFEKYADPANGGPSDDFVINDQPIEFSKVDDRTVDFILPEVSAPALEGTIFKDKYVIPEHVFSEVSDFSVSFFEGVDHVGSGPYQLAEHNRGQYAIFEANPNYYGEEPNIQNVVLQLISEPATARTALQNGEVDTIKSDVTQLENFDENSFDIHKFSEARVVYLGLNTVDESLADANVRQALLYAIDKEAINQAVYGAPENYYTPASFIPSENQWVNTDVNQFERDVEKAQSLLEEAGASNPSFTLHYNGANQAISTIATLVQAQAAEAGINIELLSVDQSALQAMLKDPENTDYQLFLNDYMFGPDPDQYSSLFLIGGSRNYFNLNDEGIDQLFRQGRVELDPDSRREIYDQAQADVLETAAFYPISEPNSVIVSNPRIQNFEEAELFPIYTIKDISKLTIEE